MSQLRTPTGFPVKKAAAVVSFDMALLRTLTSPTLARHHTTSFLGEHDHDSVAADAGLVVSELVSNAVMHATGPIHLAVSVEAILRVEVLDGDNRVERVVLRRLDAGTPGGRGLQIVNTLAESWGTIPHKDGKAVWAELKLPGRGIETGQPAAPSHDPTRPK